MPGKNRFVFGNLFPWKWPTLTVVYLGTSSESKACDSKLLEKISGVFEFVLELEVYSTLLGPTASCWYLRKTPSSDELFCFLSPVHHYNGDNYLHRFSFRFQSSHSNAIEPLSYLIQELTARVVSIVICDSPRETTYFRMIRIESDCRWALSNWKLYDLVNIHHTCITIESIDKCQ